MNPIRAWYVYWAVQRFGGKAAGVQVPMGVKTIARIVLALSVGLLRWSWHMWATYGDLSILPVLALYVAAVALGLYNLRPWAHRFVWVLGILGVASGVPMAILFWDQTPYGPWAVAIVALLAAMGLYIRTKNVRAAFG